MKIYELCSDVCIYGRVMIKNTYGIQITSELNKFIAPLPKIYIILIGASVSGQGAKKTYLTLAAGWISHSLRVSFIF